MNDFNVEQAIEDQKVLFEILHKHDKELRQRKGVTGAGIGLRQINGQFTNEVCLFVEVEKKLPIDSLEEGQLLPISLDGVHVDVIEKRATVRAVRKTEVNEVLDTQPPLSGGDAITNNLPDPSNSYVGTLGAMVYVADKNDPYIAILTCHHVLYDNGGQVDNFVYRPYIAGTYAVANITTGGVDNSGITEADYCLAQMAYDQKANNQVRFIGTLAGIKKDGLIAVNQKVRKYGITTGVTSGFITNIYMLPASPDTTITYFSVVEGDNLKDPTKKFADLGDSGAVVVDESNYVLGMVVSVNTVAGDYMTYASYLPFINNQYSLNIQIPIPSTNQVQMVLSDTDRMKSYRTELQKTSYGQEILNAINGMVEECTALHNFNKACIVAWKRNKGMEFLSLIKDVNTTEPYRIKKVVDGIKVEDMVNNMAAAYIQNGSEQLGNTMKKFAAEVAAYIKACDTVEDVIAAINKKE